MTIGNMTQEEQIVFLRAQRDHLQATLARAFDLLHEVRPIIGSDELHDRVEAFLVGASAEEGR
jgi:hypothetical protein